MLPNSYANRTFRMCGTMGPRDKPEDDTGYQAPPHNSLVSSTHSFPSFCHPSLTFVRVPATR
jgi:hypothetical protein